MRRLTLFCGSLLFLMVVAACGDDEPVEVASSPQALWERARSAMAELDSYRIAFVFPTRPEDALGEYRWEVEYDAPDSYRFLLFGAEGETEEICESYTLPGGSGFGQTCREVFTKITGRTVSETVLVGDTIYGRQCEDIDRECDPWQEQPRGPIAVAGPSPSFFPQWPQVALELAGDFEDLGMEEIDGVRLLHVRGSVNHLRAIFENQRRVLTAAGITSFGGECTAEASLPEEPPGEQTCRELTFEESLERQEPQLSFYDEHPAIIDLWVDPEDYLVRRIAIEASPPPGEPESQDMSFVVDYSQFNQVKIEAPLP
jgi:hypothetical protein